MPNSQFDHMATLQADGTVQVHGTITSAEPLHDVEFRFMLIQDTVVVLGTGQQQGMRPGWSGTTAPDQGHLHPGGVLAIGLALVARTEPGGGLGYETFTWSQQIELGS